MHGFNTLLNLDVISPAQEAVVFAVDINMEHFFSSKSDNINAAFGDR